MKLLMPVPCLLTKQNKKVIKWLSKQEWRSHTPAVTQPITLTAAAESIVMALTLNNSRHYGPKIMTLFAYHYFTWLNSHVVKACRLARHVNLVTSGLYHERTLECDVHISKIVLNEIKLNENWLHFNKRKGYKALYHLTCTVHIQKLETKRSVESTHEKTLISSHRNENILHI